MNKKHKKINIFNDYEQRWNVLNKFYFCLQDEEISINNPLMYSDLFDSDFDIKQDEHSRRYYRRKLKKSWKFNH